MSSSTIIEHSIDEYKAALDNLIAINNIKTIRISDLTLVKNIGKGGQSTVYEGFYQSNHIVLKILTNIDYMCLIHEITILANINHQSIPKFYGIVHYERTLGMVFEFIKGKTLDEIKVNEISYKQKLNIAKLIGNVLEYLHANYFIHRDLKPGNIIINDTYTCAFLIDFGISKVTINHRNSRTISKGTMNYLAPECLVISELSYNEEIISIIDSKVDVWSFGCLLSYLFSGVAPWENLFGNDIYSIQRALVQKMEFPLPEKLLEEEEIANIVRMCTINDPDKRLSMKTVMDLLYDIPSYE
jgi:serine/threonine protein kinase